MRAPLIIHAEQEAHAYDDEFTIILSDWYHERATKLNNKVRTLLVRSRFLYLGDPLTRSARVVHEQVQSDRRRTCAR